MEHSPVLTGLHSYYDGRGIGALRFACPHRGQCAAESPGFTTAKEAYVGPQYEADTLPRLLFVSLDSGSADPDPATKTLEANREWMRGASVASFPKGRHWYETHELAWFLLRQFKPDLTVEKIGPYFAHTNSAKCCLNNPGRALASETLFRNCRGFIPNEIRTLRPDILVTQGDYARDAVSGAFDVESRQAAPDGAENCWTMTLRLTPTQRAIWFHTYHPSAYGLYWRQKNACWPIFAQAVAAFVAGRHLSPSVGVEVAGAGGDPASAPAAPRRLPPPTAPSLPPLATRTIRNTGDPSHDAVVAAFNTQFKLQGRPFGTSTARNQGVSDDARGLQWNAGVDRELDTAWLGVNLEGMAYDDWPIARFIERELDRPEFLDLSREMAEPATVVMEWFRDAWQASARLPIAEHHIGRTPITLDRLTPETWRHILLEAYGCLDANRNHRGRALQVVTLKSGPVEKWVSPHLHIHSVLWQSRYVPMSQAETLMRQARDVLAPVYEFVKRRSR